jgi:hypothetical protein
LEKGHKEGQLNTSPKGLSFKSWNRCLVTATFFSITVERIRARIRVCAHATNRAYRHVSADILL